VAKPLICVVGAGTAGLEGLLSAREQLGSAVDLRLIAPEQEFRYRPMSRDSLFRPARERSLAITELVAEAGATWLRDRADVINEAERSLLSRDGDTVDFDFLLLAPGARSRRALRQGFVWQRGGDPSFLDSIISDLVSGKVGSVAVVVPRGARWPLPAYELALILAWTAAGTAARITLLTAERQPLGALGPQATEVVTLELDAADVEVIAGVEVLDEQEDQPTPPELADLILMTEDSADGSDALIGRPTDPARVRLGRHSAVEFDRLISLPTVLGPFITGVATDAAGFVEVDETLRVCGSERVWAAGGCVAAALEHSALAAQQADAALTAIAAASGAEIGAMDSSAPELTGMLLTGQRVQWLAENPVGTHEPSTRCLWWPPGRAVGRMLAKRIAAWDPSIQDALPGQPSGLVIRAPVALGCGGRPTFTAATDVSAATRAARLRDIENRQLMAVRRRERDADAELRAMSARLETLTTNEQQVVRELQHHGYLRDHAQAPSGRARN
jgi:sulfide:quinone oxidoreductase